MTTKRQAPRHKAKSPRKAPAKRPATPGSRGPAPGRGRAAPADGRRRSFLWRWRRPLFLVGLLLIAAAAGVGFALSQIKLPPERINAQTSYICAGDVQNGCDEQNALAKLSGDQDRTNVALAEVPRVLVNAVLAAEDRDFYKHGGVDPLGIVRAFWADLRNKGSTQGGSTITQQYVKNAYLTDERSFTRKIKEAVLAVKVEHELSKDQILERYLNTIYFGRGAYGVGAGARVWFGHDLATITLPEAAYLAGLIRSPETADAVTDKGQAQFRRHSVLVNMLDAGWITKADFDAADAVPFTIASAPGAADGFVQPRTPKENIEVRQGSDIGSDYFVAYVHQQLRDHGFSDDEIYGGGLRIYTTLDLKAQQDAWNAVTSTLTPTDPSAALLSLDPQGHIIAMVGGRDFASDQVNLAVGADGGGSGRQAGSSFKPFVLAAALQQGFSLKSQFDAPSQIVLPHADGGKDWKVDNAEPSSGVLNLIDATRVSSNTVFAQLMVKVKPQNVVPLAHAMGITSDLPEVNSLVLGSAPVSPLEMASGYSTFAHRGTHITPLAITRVVRPDGSTVTFDQSTSQPLTESQADQVTYALRQVVSGGTGTGAAFGKPAAGKTGTTDDYKDAWFVGFTPNGYTTAVWMGYENPPGSPPKYMNSVHGKAVYGGTFPATMWRKYMSTLLGDTDVGSFHDPTSFGGKVLNADLTTTTSAPGTTTTAPTTSTTSTSTTSTTTTTTSEPETTTTTTTTTTLPGGGGGGGGPPPPN